MRAFATEKLTTLETMMSLLESAVGEPEGSSLRMPAERNALHEPFKFQVPGLGPFQNGLHNVGGEEREAHDATDVSPGHALSCRFA